MSKFDDNIKMDHKEVRLFDTSGPLAGLCKHDNDHSCWKAGNYSIS